MAVVACAAIAGLVSGGGIAGITAYFNAGSHYEKGAKVEVDTVHVHPNGFVNFTYRQVYQDNSKALLRVNSWEAEVVLVFVFGALALHLLGALWGTLAGRCHAAIAHTHELTKKELDHHIHLGKAKDETIIEMEKVKKAQDDLEKATAYHHDNMQALKKGLARKTARSTVWSETDSEPATIRTRRSSIKSRASVLADGRRDTSLQRPKKSLQEFLDSTAETDF